MRFAAYAGTSVVLATGTIIRAFHERSNFYSASVSIAQSNASLMILTNVALLGVWIFMLGLQRLFYGPLRPIEVEQLYEKAWFAITETCLAMTIFREEVGGWFMVMFVSLLIGKVWGWIGEGRVEVLEQQPPANSRLFHTQLSVSLSISSLFDFFMLRYAVITVLRHARPNMMVMFAFEFAVLTVNSLSTAARYGISVFEASVIRKQIDERRSQMRREREEAHLEALRTQSSSDGDVTTDAARPENDIETLDIDAPGWEEKGRWIFYLDLTTDFLKLVLYLTFFCVLCMFYGMPIHIIRDVALTVRSFLKRIRDFMRYRQATRDMNSRYPDATAEEIAREDVCIICRENMRAWSIAQNVQASDSQVQNSSTTNRIDERSRPKKLPCGHILHSACLRSWLERQQNCPTCRRPVLTSIAANRAQAPPVQQQHPRPQAPPPPNQPLTRAQVGQAGQNPTPPRNVYQFGPVRIAFGARQLPQRPEQNNLALLDQQAVHAATGNLPRNQEPVSGQVSQTNLGPRTTMAQLQQIEQGLIREINGLNLQYDQMYLVRALQGELTRLRLLEANSVASFRGSASGIPHDNFHVSTTQASGDPYVAGQPSQSANGERQLPAGITIPIGWTMVPLRRMTADPGLNAEARGLSSDRAAPAEPPVSVATATIRSGQPLGVRAAQGETSVTEAPDNDSPKDLEDDIQIKNQSRAGVTVNESGDQKAADSPRLRRETAEATSSRADAEIPNWGSTSITPQLNPTLEAREESMSGASIETEISARNHKGETRNLGKGKATTIEDSNEDID